MTLTAVAPTNIAILKYWGKISDSYHIPTKSSLSFTVEKLCSTTSLSAEKGSMRIDFKLNGKKAKEGSKEHNYVKTYLGFLSETLPFIRNYDYRIESENNFPTAAGFASSASGFAALLKALSGELEEFSELRDDDKRLSALARLGSGSAARSIPSKGGFVKWDRGSAEDWERDPVYSSHAYSLFGPEHWPELRIIYVTVESKEKKIRSMDGMAESVRTNPLYQAWVDHEESLLKNDMIDAVGKKDFDKLAGMVMQASNSFHSICHGTYPPIYYLKPKSLQIIDSVHELNKGKMKAAYTFDAGPNPVIITRKKDEMEVLKMLDELVGEVNLYRTKPGPGPRYSKKNLF
jgi:diphosphomevalonate decarboxylase